MKMMVILLSLIPLATSFPKWYCGPSDHTIFNSLLSLPCLHPNLNDICHEHDLCYDYQLGYELCNQIMCNKLRLLDSGWCINDSTAFFMCSVIRNFGRGRYITAGEKLSSLTSKGEVNAEGFLCPSWMISKSIMILLLPFSSLACLAMSTGSNGAIPASSVPWRSSSKGERKTSLPDKDYPLYEDLLPPSTHRPLKIEEAIEEL